MTQTLNLFFAPLRSDKNAIFLPSGDQAGRFATVASLNSVSGFAPVPSVIQRLLVALVLALPSKARSDTNAIGVRIGRFRGFDVLLPLETVMVTFPALARNFAGILAVSILSLTNVVARFVAFHRTTEACTKSEPFTVKVESAVCVVVVATAGERLIK